MYNFKYFSCLRAFVISSMGGNKALCSKSEISYIEPLFPVSSGNGNINLKGNINNSDNNLKTNDL